jgi:hypothetical protein
MDLGGTAYRAIAAEIGTMISTMISTRHSPQPDLAAQMLYHERRRRLRNDAQAMAQIMAHGEWLEPGLFPA